MAVFKNVFFQYSVDRGRTWYEVKPDENTAADSNSMKQGENTLTINKSGKTIMIRILSTLGQPSLPFVEISDINIIYRNKYLK